MEPFIFWILLLSGILKLCITAVCLNTGWRGGHIFPIIFWVKYRIRCSIYSSYRSSSICCHRNNSNFKLCVTKANSYNITITYVFPLNLLLPMLGAAIGNAFPLPKHNENKINKIGNGDESSTVYFYYLCFNNASNSSKLCTSYVGIIPLSFNFLSD